MRNFPLHIGGDNFGLERQADGLPTLRQVDIAVRCTLIPHALATAEGVADRTIEVLLVNQQVVAGSFEGALYQMAFYCSPLVDG